MLSDEQKKFIDKTAKENGFKKFSVSVEEGSKKGDNYLGNIFLINVKEKDASNEDCYILKCAETNPDVRTQMPIHKVYERELFLYQKVLPTFKNFQEKYCLKHGFGAFAKFLGSLADDGKEFLLMENIKSRGFHMLDRKKTMDDEHVSLVFRELAKFHSVSLAMNHLEPDTYKHLAKNLEDYFQETSLIQKSFEDSMAKKLDNTLKMFKGHQKASQALIKFQGKVKSLLDEYRDEKNHIVIIHGDPWCNNMMFKYEDHTHPTVPTSMCFLDWQISRTQSPTADLYYFLFLSGSREILDNYQKYLDQYYEIIDENLQSIGCDTKVVFPYQLFREHCIKFVHLGLLVALSNLQTLLKEEKDAKSFAEMTEKGNNLLDQLWAEDMTDQYCQRLKDIILMMVENEFL